MLLLLPVVCEESQAFCQDRIKRKTGGGCLQVCWVDYKGWWVSAANDDTLRCWASLGDCLLEIPCSGAHRICFTAAKDPPGTTCAPVHTGMRSCLLLKDALSSNIWFWLGSALPFS